MLFPNWKEWLLQWKPVALSVIRLTWHSIYSLCMLSLSLFAIWYGYIGDYPRAVYALGLWFCFRVDDHLRTWAKGRIPLDIHVIYRSRAVEALRAAEAAWGSEEPGDETL